MATMIVKGVAVNVGDPTSTTPVNIGTITPRAAASFTVNLTTTTPLPAGALVGFYQTLPGTTEVPYLIEQQPIDPFTRAFALDRAISAASLDYGTFSGSAVSWTHRCHTHRGRLDVPRAASAPLFTDGVLTTHCDGACGKLRQPPHWSRCRLYSLLRAQTSTTTVTVSQTTTGTTFDKGDLIVSHDGAIVATTALDSINGA